MLELTNAQIGGWLGAAPVMVQAAGHQGEAALMTAPDAVWPANLAVQ